MTLGEWGAIGSIVASIVAVIGSFSRVLVRRMERNLRAPLISLTPLLVQLYRKTCASVFDHVLEVEKGKLYDELDTRHKLTPIASRRLTWIEDLHGYWKMNWLGPDTESKKMRCWLLGR
jgi:hypothetical protein